MDMRPARGTLLVARSHLLDPNFARTVVLLCDHDDARGSFGFVLNRPSEKGLHEALQGVHDFQGRRDTVFVGGPVGLDSLAILHRLPGIPGASEVVPGVLLGGEVEPLGDRVAAEGTPEADLRFLVGYAGWGEGQLAREMEEGTWVVCPATPEWVFDGEPGSLWRRVLRSMGGPYAMMGLAPVDPEMN